MAEPQTTPAEGEGQRPPPGNGNDHEPIDWQARAAEAEKKLGQLVNENKRIKAARDDIATNVKRWSQLEEASYTSEHIQELLGKQEKDALEQARDKGEVDKLLENQRKTFEKQIKAAEERANKIFEINRKLFVDDVVNRALDKVGVEPRLKRGAFEIYRHKFMVIEDPESPYGMRTVVKVGADDFMDPDEFMKNEAENNEEFSPYLKQSVATGGGAGGGAGARLRFKPRSEMTAKEKSDAITAMGKEAYEKIPWKR